MDIDQYIFVQSVAKSVHAKLVKLIGPGSTEASIVENAVQLLYEAGITETWYHNVPAFILLGSRSCLSISGRDYQPSEEKVGKKNLVTVDLSPSLKGVWGDCARSYFVEDGVCRAQPSGADFIQGLRTELQLHEEMMAYVKPETRFCDLFAFGNQKIKDCGFENLDFLGNLGHSIENDPSRRRYIDQDCKEKLGDVSMFTFEPHIRKKGFDWGYKHENIYYFQNGFLKEL
ncbi:MAG: Xaa-Pro aminopeptidase [Oceanospirillaceae bacterium]|nr:Xaa-Pro aminopeptidase [Oceanospirillaceae bacterium]|tara:strand:- start:389 stop:1078 length:690 start_codon:yes stop_codon:yes gene_type:complete